MVLQISSKSFTNREIDSAKFDILRLHTELEDNNARFFDRSLTRIFSSDDCKNLYVFQGEMCIVRPTEDKVQFILTDDTTTCMTVIIRHVRTGVTCLIHCDTLDDDHVCLSELSNLFHDISKIAAESPALRNQDDFSECHFQVSLFGGYLDERRTSEELFVTLLQLLNSISGGFVIHLHCAFTGHLNTTNKLATFGPIKGTMIKAPIIYGAAIHLNTGRMYNAALDHSDMKNIPMQNLRRSLFAYERTFFWNIYDTVNDCIQIEPRQLYDEIGRNCRQTFKYRSMMPDEHILLNYSTSPFVEPPHFTSDFRQLNQFYYMNCQQNLSQMFFPHGQSRRFVVANNKWTEG